MTKYPHQTPFTKACVNAMQWPCSKSSDPIASPGRPNSFKRHLRTLGGFSLERRSLLSSTSAKITESAILDAHLEIL